MVGDWVDTELPRLNRAVLRSEIPHSAVADQTRDLLLPHLPAIDRLDPSEARRLVVRLGFVGASVARHYQEWNPGGKETPERAFDDLTVDGHPFRDYFAALAAHTGAGHYGRDSYASLVRWNVGTIEVRCGAELLAVLPGVFDDGNIRSYTGTPGEERFFLLVKQAEALELAVNEMLCPLSDEDACLVSEGAIERVRLATALILAMRSLFLDFAALPPDESMPADHFMDVFRQFAVHWTAGDIPPSGALDPEALKRDFLLGIAITDYDRHVRRLFPALLDGERATIEELMARPTLPQRLLDHLDLDAGTLADRSPAELRHLIGAHPALVDWYRLLTAHARAAGAHLMLSQKFLFKPQRRRDVAGQGDKPLVSNRRGTTGMNETFLERLTRARRNHPLAPLRTALTGETAEKVRAAEVPSAASVSVALVG
ncbi:hypothetical protein ACQP2F_06175 [Actinoplanes sp. CA-030573]|uniref:hypothetical protein n=1 Tax=Actinoplanes sp. CA-030573 TaxID=3239898 RepID=UPI003D8B36C7